MEAMNIQLTNTAAPPTRMAAGRFRQLRLLLWKNWLFSVSDTIHTVLLHTVLLGG